MNFKLLSWNFDFLKSTGYRRLARNRESTKITGHEANNFLESVWIVGTCLVASEYAPRQLRTFEPWWGARAKYRRILITVYAYFWLSADSKVLRYGANQSRGFSTMVGHNDPVTSTTATAAGCLLFD